MSHTPHDLAADFPQLADKIHDLKMTDAHFARLLEEYQAINDQVHRAETLVAPVEELTEVEMRKKRAALKDQLYRLLTAAA